MWVMGVGGLVFGYLVTGLLVDSVTGCLDDWIIGCVVSWLGDWVIR